MKDEPKEYTVVTRYAPVKMDGRPIVHTYGPYTKSKAKSIRANMRAESVQGGWVDRLEISVCHLIDVDDMNREKARQIAQDMTAEQ